MLLLVLPSGALQALLVAYFLFLFYVGILIHRKMKAGRGREILPLIGLGLLPVVLFVLLLAFG